MLQTQIIHGLEVLDDASLVQRVPDGVEEMQLFLRLQRVELEWQKQIDLRLIYLKTLIVLNKRCPGRGGRGANLDLLVFVYEAAP